MSTGNVSIYACELSYLGIFKSVLQFFCIHTSNQEAVLILCVQNQIDPAPQPSWLQLL
jgi:hypothetical protein